MIQKWNIPFRLGNISIQIWLFVSKNFIYGTFEDKYYKVLNDKNGQKSKWIIRTKSYEGQVQKDDFWVHRSQAEWERRTESLVVHKTLRTFCGCREVKTRLWSSWISNSVKWEYLRFKFDSRFYWDEWTRNYSNIKTRTTTSRPWYCRTEPGNVSQVGGKKEDNICPDNRL